MTDENEEEYDLETIQAHVNVTMALAYETVLKAMPNYVPSNSTNNIFNDSGTIEIKPRPPRCVFETKPVREEWFSHPGLFGGCAFSFSL